MNEFIKAYRLAMDAIKRKREKKAAPMATCPSCGEPLIMTMRFPGKEFICVECHSLWGFVEPVPKEITPELSKRYQELREKWEAELERQSKKQ